MIEPLAAPLRRIGVDVVGVADGAAWQRVLPGCRSVVVFASGGDALWRAWLRHLAGRPAELDLPHPLDAFVRSALPADTGQVRWLPCAADAPLQVDFRALALAAGLGWRSRLDLVLHPTHGPWLGLRAAAFTTAALRPTPGPAAPSPCLACDAPCARACPAGALDRGLWDAGPCLAWQAASAGCSGGCLARSACPVGAASRYGPEQHAYHHTHDRAHVRRALTSRDAARYPPA